jgi:hypothetical protein
MILQLHFKQFAIGELIFRIENTFRCHPAAPWARDSLKPEAGL